MNIINVKMRNAFDEFDEFKQIFVVSFRRYE